MLPRIKQYIEREELGVSPNATVYRVHDESEAHRGELALKLYNNPTAGAGFSNAAEVENAPVDAGRENQAIIRTIEQMSDLGGGTRAGAGIIPILDYGTTDDGRVWYVTEAYSQSLENRMRRVRDADELHFVVTSILKALQQIHATGRPHGHLTLNNILVGGEKSKPLKKQRIVLGDLAIHTTGSLESDLHPLGLIIFKLVTGRELNPRFDNWAQSEAQWKRLGKHGGQWKALSRALIEGDADNVLSSNTLTGVISYVQRLTPRNLAVMVGVPAVALALIGIAVLFLSGKKEPESGKFAISSDKPDAAFKILDATGNEVWRGDAGDAPTPLAPGTYKILGKPNSLEISWSRQTNITIVAGLVSPVEFRFLRAGKTTPKSVASTPTNRTTLPKTNKTASTISVPSKTMIVVSSAPVRATYTYSKNGGPPRSLRSGDSIDAGQYIVTATSAPWPPKTKPLTITAGQESARLDFEFKYARLTVATEPANATVEFRGSRSSNFGSKEFKNLTPSPSGVAGETITVSMVGYQPTTKTVTLTEDANRSLTITLKPDAPPPPDSATVQIVGLPSGTSVRAVSPGKIPKSITSGAPTALATGTWNLVANDPRFGNSTSMPITLNRGIPRQVRFAAFEFQKGALRLLFDSDVPQSTQILVNNRAAVRESARVFVMPNLAAGGVNLSTSATRLRIADTAIANVRAGTEETLSLRLEPDHRELRVKLDPPQTSGISLYHPTDGRFPPTRIENGFAIWDNVFPEEKYEVEADWKSLLTNRKSVSIERSTPLTQIDLVSQYGYIEFDWPSYLQVNLRAEGRSRQTETVKRWIAPRDGAPTTFTFEAVGDYEPIVRTITLRPDQSRVSYPLQESDFRKIANYKLILAFDRPMQRVSLQSMTDGGEVAALRRSATAFVASDVPTGEHRLMATSTSGAQHEETINVSNNAFKFIKAR